MDILSVNVLYQLYASIMMMINDDDDDDNNNNKCTVSRRTMTVDTCFVTCKYFNDNIPSQRSNIICTCILCSRLHVGVHERTYTHTCLKLFIPRASMHLVPFSQINL
jgi:hypothetical protein